MAVSYALKLDRAFEHLARLKEHADQWIALNAEPFPFRARVQGDETVILYEPATPFPADELALAAGDALHNFRVALDHLAYELAIRFSGDPLPADCAETSEFPIFGKRPSQKQLSRKIGCIDPLVQTVIDGLQPYNAGNNYREEPLWMLHELERIDKHRLLHVVVITLLDDSLGGENVAVSARDTFRGPLEYGIEVARFRVNRVNPNTSMRVEQNFSTVIALDRGVPLAGVGLVSGLRGLFQALVESVVNPLQSYL